MNQKIMVSICCLTYNQEKYIRKTLEGFVNQKTNFKFEILIHDDASTDDTANIIREYEKKFPDMIKPIYQLENQFSKGVKINNTYQFPRIRGKYFAMCEGDDYWTDYNKLQKQYDALESHEDCAMCTHIVNRIYENEQETGITQPINETIEKLKGSILDNTFLFQNIFISDLIPFQTSSYFFRTEYIQGWLEDIKVFSKIPGVGDLPMVWYYITKGKVFFLPKIMSKYRVGSIGNITEKLVGNYDLKIKHYSNLLDFFESYNKYTNYIYAEDIEKIKTKYEFIVFEMTNSYKNLVQRKYKNMLKERNLKYRVYVHLCAMFPSIQKMYCKIRKYKDKE